MGNARCFFPIFLLATLLSIALPSPFNFILETTHTVSACVVFVFSGKKGSNENAGFSSQFFYNLLFILSFSAILKRKPINSALFVCRKEKRYETFTCRR